MPTTRIPRDFKEFLKSLDAHNARFMLIGGYAVSAFGYVRNTVATCTWPCPSIQSPVEPGTSEPLYLEGLILYKVTTPAPPSTTNSPSGEISNRYGCVARLSEFGVPLIVWSS